MEPQEKLYKQWSLEKETKSLAKMENGFYSEMSEYIMGRMNEVLAEIESKLMKGAKMEPFEIKKLMEEKIKYDLDKVNEIYKLRVDKSIEAIRNNSFDFGNLTFEERVLYESFKISLDRYREQSLGGVGGVVESGNKKMLSLVERYVKGREKTEILEPSKIKESIMDMLNSASNSVFLVSPWIWGVDVILESLEKLKGKNLDIRVVCRPALEEDVAHAAIVERLNEAGIPIHFSSIVHAKYLIVDEVEVLFTSANLTKTSLERNIEMGMRTYGIEIVEKYVSEFNKLWESTQKI